MLGLHPMAIKAFTFDDVLLVPSYNHYESRRVVDISMTDKTGKLIALRDVTDKDDLMIITTAGITIRMSVSDLREMGRATQGVRVINLSDGDEIAAVAKVDVEAKEESAETVAGNSPENSRQTDSEAKSDSNEDNPA